MSTHLDGLKRSARRELKRQRAALSPEQRDLASTTICAALAAHPAWLAANSVALYMPLPNEVSTLPLLEHIAHKRVGLPVVARPHAPLVFRRWEPGAPLVSGAFGVLEPSSAADVLDGIDLFVVPALSVDASGRRLGYGGGYYDRTLPLHPRATRVALCFEALRRATLPVDEHDQRVHILITEAGVTEYATASAP